MDVQAGVPSDKNTWQWTCCNCHNGNISYHHDSGCQDCGHSRDSTCSIWGVPDDSKDGQCSVVGVPNSSIAKSEVPIKKHDIAAMGVGSIVDDAREETSSDLDDTAAMAKQLEEELEQMHTTFRAETCLENEYVQTTDGLNPVRDGKKDNDLREEGLSSGLSVPVELHLDDIDALLSQSIDEREIQELKQQERLLRNRQGFLRSITRMKKQQRAQTRVTVRLGKYWAKMQKITEHARARLQKTETNNGSEIRPRGHQTPLNGQPPVLQDRDMRFISDASPRPQKQISINRHQSITGFPSADIQRGMNDSLAAGEWHIAGAVNGVDIQALADTGANINAISKNEADRRGLIPEKRGAGRTIRLPSGKICHSLGTTNINFNFSGEETIHNLRCTIVDRLEYSMVVCYDFLEKTQTLTRHFKQRIKEVARTCLHKFPLCLLEDVAAASETRARMEGLINGESVKVVPDTGSGIMAVSAKYAKRLGLQVDTSRRTKVVFADGSSAITSGTVKATWNFVPPDSQTDLRACLDDGGQALDSKGTKRLISSSDIESANNAEDQGNAWDYDWEYEWHVIEDLPVDAILSLSFIKQHDVFGRHQHAFVRTLPSPAMAEILGICELPGGSKELKSLAGEFISDLSSRDPFSLDMIVRESARQGEIRRRIEELHADGQNIQLLIEEARIQAWKRIEAAKRNGENWCQLRAEYLRNLSSRSTQLSWPQDDIETPVASSQGRANKRGILWLWRR
ncbi:hypothetical protein GGR57DRAFT_503580 [Xylariaceae sp. FL1272]|nr:hypothetical protein GGR57DRAFT_503580 [Xylariaceae sp. FL1272]